MNNDHHDLIEARACSRLLQLGLPDPASRAWPPTTDGLELAFPELEFAQWLGEGATGVVFQVRERAGGEQSALKIIRPALMADSESASRFVRETEALQRMSHPAIAGVRDFGEQGGWFYLRMDYVAARNLREAVDAPVDPRQAIDIVVQVCEALQYAHDLGVVHRDIKPENILLDDLGRVTLVDFGLAKLRHGENAWTLTGASMVLGTPLYLAPEQIETPSIVDGRADVFSTGVVLYELLTGKLPIGRFAKPSALVAIDRSLDRLVLRALEPDRERRFASAAQLRDALLAVRRRVGRGRRWGRGLLAGSAFAAAVVSWPLMPSESASPPTRESLAAAEPEPEPAADALASVERPIHAGQGTRAEVHGEGIGSPIPESSPSQGTRMSVEGLWAEGQEAEAVHRWARARRAYDEILETHPNHRLAEAAHLQIGRTYFEERTYKAAAASFYDFLQQRPRANKVAMALYYGGLSFAKLGRCEDAIAYFEAITRPATRASADVRDKARTQVRILREHLSGERLSPKLHCGKESAEDVPDLG